jgi:hypothetical protein
MDAQLDWYKYQEDSEPIEVWAFTRTTFEASSGGIFGNSRGSCFAGQEGTVVDAHTGAFIVEGFTGSGSTPCPD